MTDWTRIIAELRDSGISYSDMKRHTGVRSANTFREIESTRTKEPRHSLGVRLLALHKRHCNRKAP